jgi:hypothetical protein
MPIHHRFTLRRLSAALAVVATAASAVLSGPASASAAPPPVPALPAGVTDAAIPIDDPLAVIGALAPDLLRETSAPATPDEAGRIAAETGVSPFSAIVPGDPATPIRLSPATTEGAGLPVAVSIDYAQEGAGNGSAADGITSYVGQHVAAYVQPVMNGVRLMTAIDDESAGENFSYTFDLPDGSSTTPLPGGDTLLADASHHYIGTLAAAWAVDASGAALDTGYSWEGNTLTQHVELDADTAFPVLIDPLWFYSYDFNATVPGYHANHPKASEAAVSRLLHGCFNCYFPINGAPRGYPADGDILNLNASPFSLEALRAPVRVQTANGGAMQFLAQAGHFDGAGSLITFSWYNDPSGYIHLYVHAKIVRDLGPHLNIINSRIAGANWLFFWQRVADNANGSSGGGGV